MKPQAFLDMLVPAAQACQRASGIPASFMLGHVLQRQGQPAQALAQYRRADALYLTQGHVPLGVGSAIASLSKPPKAGSSSTGKS